MEILMSVVYADITVISGEPDSSLYNELAIYVSRFSMINLGRCVMFVLYAMM